MNNIETLKMALEALEEIADEVFSPYDNKLGTAILTLRQAIAEAEQVQPEFTTHAVENAYDWSEWVCPDPKGYLMKCCDCGLVHEAEFKVVRYKSKAEREDCEPVVDPNVQAVFRMRRSQQWSPKDTAHRAGGLPMEQAEQVQPVAVVSGYYGGQCVILPTNPAMLFNSGTALYTSPPPRQWVGLTDEEIDYLCQLAYTGDEEFIKTIEAKLKEKNT